MALSSGSPRTSGGDRSRYRGNHILSQLTEDDYGRLSRQFKMVAVRPKQTVVSQGERLQEVVFPTASVFSLMRSTDDGNVIELAEVGSEGIIGAGAILEQSVSDADVVVLHALHGDEPSLSFTAFTHELQRHGPLFTYVKEYYARFVTLLMHNGACNAVHSAQQRCARELLSVHDRVKRDEFPMTHEILAGLIGVRRPTVTIAMAAMARAGCIDQSRGKIAILDRLALESQACRCYRLISSALSIALACA